MLAALVVVVLVVAGVLWLGESRGWAFSADLRRRVDTVWPHVTSYVTLAPATFIYLFVLFITSWVLRSSSPIAGHVLLSTHSTNLANLHRDPVGVLVTSAFWLSSPQVARWGILFVLVMAPVERWLGTLRMIVAFAAGHVLATLLTAAVLENQLLDLVGDDASRRAIDVGVSYGFFAVAALFTYRLRGRWRWLWAASIVAAVAVPYVLNRTFTDFGHLLAAAIGFSLFPLSRGAAAQARRAMPIWRPPAEAVDSARAAMLARRHARRP